MSAPAGPPRSSPPRSSVKSGLDEPGSAPAAPPRRGKRLAVLGRLGLVVVLLLAVAGTVYFTSQRSQYGRDDAGAQEIPALEVAPAPVQLGTVAQPDALAVPGTEALPAAPTRRGSSPAAPQRRPAPAQGRASMASWANALASRVGIPARALQAYGIADLSVRAEDPGCHLSWVTVAGLARIESNHGRYRGSGIDANGRIDPPIIGVPLDGTSGNRTIGDTDGGVLDGDATLDRAVGPFQFIPSTWAKWRSDGNGDGIGDPNNIDDASVAAGRYLCANGRDLATGEGWREAVLSYNASDEYGRRVYAAASQYAAASRS